MRYRSLSILALVFIGGCVGSVPVEVKLDTAVVDELPPSIAINYLNKVSSASDLNLHANIQGYNSKQIAKYASSARCTFSDKGLSMKAQYHPEWNSVLFPYNELRMSSENKTMTTGNLITAMSGSVGRAYILDVEAIHTPEVNGRFGGPFQCSIIAEAFPGELVPQVIIDKASKTASALKSLGVKIGQDK